VSAVLDFLPRGNTLSDDAWQRRHRLLQIILAGHVPALFVYGLARGFGLAEVCETLVLPVAALLIGHYLRSRRLAAGFVTLGLVYCSGALVGFSDGAIEAHFHFFIIIGFIALYQDWVPFLLNILFTVLSHGIGSSFVPDLMFNHASAQQHPWAWSLIHGVSVLAACIGVVLFWKNTEDEQNKSLELTQRLADAEIGQRRFTSDLLVNLARRNQNLLHRQLELLNQLEDKERDPDALADLFRLDHLATRIRRNAESLLVLSGEESPRTWREPVALVDVVRAAIAEIEDLDRVDYAMDESLSVVGRSVADLTHLFAELLENAVHFSPPGVIVMVRNRPLPNSPGTQLVTVEDWGVGMTPGEMAEANELLRAPRDVDLSVSQRLGLHVVARLAHRYGIAVELTATPGGGVTAVAVLPPSLFADHALVGAGAPVLAGATAAPARGTVDWPFPAGPVEPSRNGNGGPVRGPDGMPPELTRRVPRTPDTSGRPPAGRTPDNLTGPPAPPTVDRTGSPASAAGDLGGFRTGSATPATGGRTGSPTPAKGDLTGSPAPARDDLSSFRTGSAAPTSGDRTGLRTGSAPASGDHTGFRTGSAAPTSGDRTGLRTGSAPAAGDRAGAPAPAADLAGFRTGSAPAPGDRTGSEGDAPAAHAGGPAPWVVPPLVEQPGTGGLPRRSAGEALARTRLSGDQPGLFRSMSEPAGPSDEGWSSWWDRVTPPAGQQEEPPAPQTPQPAPEPTNGSTPATPVRLPEPRPPADDAPQLRRRVPQANLAAGLRRESEQTPAEEPPVVRDPLAARNALSRFQAAQRAAREAVEGEDGRK
jgi:signal transduction histidine kinase